MPPVQQNQPKGATAELAKPKLLVCEHGFLQALIHDDYIKHLSHICTKQIKFIVNNPTCELCVMFFNYCEVTVQIEVHSATDSALCSVLEEKGTEWINLVTCAQQSEGWLHLHVMQAMRVLVTKAAGEHMERNIIDEINTVLSDDLDTPGIH
ncbi:hypothetical protein B0H10DRAFT_1947182 [Mycena sp. CBHHK59/15]|nr:hypothetical protein B0H10DRAFT_1947182 [Mycena sp. CBHHK59/15]